MTPQEMNVKIAAVLGYYPIEYGRWAKKNEDGDIITRSSLPNYTTDKALCWDLMEILLQAGWYPQQTSYGRPPEWIAKDGHTVKNESLLLATCEAIIEEFKKDV